MRKLLISSLRLRGNIRVDPKTWQPEFVIPFYQSFPDRVPYHGKPGLGPSRLGDARRQAAGLAE